MVQLCLPAPPPIAPPRPAPAAAPSSACLKPAAFGAHLLHSPPTTLPAQLSAHNRHCLESRQPISNAGSNVRWRPPRALCALLDHPRGDTNHRAPGSVAVMELFHDETRHKPPLEPNRDFPEHPALFRVLRASAWPHRPPQARRRVRALPPSAPPPYADVARAGST